MLINLTSRILTLGVATGTLAAAAHASVIVESSRRTTLALAGTPKDGGGVDTDTSTALGPLTLSSNMGPTRLGIFASITHQSVSSPAGIAGTVNLSQIGFEDTNGVFLWGVAHGSASHAMTFVLETPTPFRMTMRTVSSTWELPQIYGLAIAAGVATSFDGGSTVVLHQVYQPVSGTSVAEGLLPPGRYTALFYFTSAAFGPNTLDLSTASLAYSLTIPAPSAGALLAVAGVACARRRSRTRAL